MTTALLLLILASLWFGFYQLFKQQGRILLRLDRLEHAPHPAHAHRESSDEPAEAAGLPLQSDFPPFSFPDLSGRSVSLAEWRGRRVLLLHWNFECGFCDSIAPQLARLEAAFAKRNAQLLLLAQGEARPNLEGAAEHGLKCPILLMTGREEAGAFQQEGTPVAYLLDEQGRVAAPVARGAERVLALALELAGPQAEVVDPSPQASHSSALPAGPPAPEIRPPHRLRLPRFLLAHEIGLGDVIKRLTSALGIKPCVGCERRAGALNRWLVLSGIGGTGLKAGTRAPVFELPDLEGRMVSLEQYRGRRVLLLFSEPQCGPCDELCPHLVHLHRERAGDGLGVIMVGRGSVEENRRKAQQHGMEFPVLLQDKKWKVSKEYDILATPAAFLISADGMITKDAAVGRDDIMALVSDGQS